MAPYIFGARNGIHIIDLEQTVPLLNQALVTVRDIVAGGGRVLFVGTKRQASDKVAEAAKRCGQYYVNHRWLGGMLTNWKTISNSIKRLRVVEEQLEGEQVGLTKKEILMLTRERDKLERALGGIKEMGNLNIPVIGVLASNSDPDGVTFPVPGNDDALRAIGLYCDLIADAVLDGIQAEMTASGTDIGESVEGPVETLPEQAEAAAAAETPAQEAAAEPKAEAEATPQA